MAAIRTEFEGLFIAAQPVAPFRRVDAAGSKWTEILPEFLSGKKSGCWGHEKQESGEEGGAVAKVGDKRQVSRFFSTIQGRLTPIIAQYNPIDAFFLLSRNFLGDCFKRTWSDRILCTNPKIYPARDNL